MVSSSASSCLILCIVSDHLKKVEVGGKSWEVVRGVGALKILVQAIAFSDQLLLPLPESMLFDLDLFGEPLS